MTFLTRSVWILSIVSFFADIASEMLYPVIPIYLKDIGFSVLAIGFLEGIAEFVVGVSKGYFGKRSDDIGKRLPFVKLGYFLSAVSKSMMVLFSFPLWIFLSRSLDRLGKGIRTSARDALLSAETTKENKGRIFGFHRSWDTLGAVLGPLIALLYLQFFAKDYKLLFLFAFIPGIIAVALIFLLKEKQQIRTNQPKQGFFSYFSYWKTATPDFKKLVTGLLIFSLANSSDVFLLLKTKQITGSDSITIGVYIFYNLVYATSSYPLGILGDKIGIKKIYIAGLMAFILVYLGFAFVTQTWVLFLLFGIYGIYAGATEGISKAWITNNTSKEKTSTALGFYTSCQSFAALAASSIAGLLWNAFGNSYSFLFSVMLVLISIVFMIKQRIG
jgi:MFS family permease